MLLFASKQDNESNYKVRDLYSNWWQKKITHNSRTWYRRKIQTKQKTNGTQQSSLLISISFPAQIYITRVDEIVKIIWLPIWVVGSTHSLSLFVLVEFVFLCMICCCCCCIVVRITLWNIAHAGWSSSRNKFLCIWLQTRVSDAILRMW